ncbi:response regulator [Silvanigrella aquatica]|uniref:Response regulatory domain-containing protein n=1 Tax=Silvanigrella aquatica TaxID=1915309 RepID=A0A1L4CX89_9BACT|nr:response regulator [Silvanigrella aquatica]APJ02565.1 hypothetical protein AXG55_00895 [Silvanigrella aquatica]
MKVLIIDDDADLLDMTIKRFKRKGIDAEGAQNLTTARELLKKHPEIKSIVCDLFLLEGENGIDFYDKDLKSNFSGKFVLATGDDTADSRIEKYKSENKNFACFQKPYAIEDVIKFIEQ